MSFVKLNLDPAIMKALDSCGYKDPTPVQQESIPAILANKDVVASAQTGTGKTAAFVLPALHKLSISKDKGNKTKILVLTPTRELADQITKAATKYGKFMRYRITSLVGGVSYQPQIRDLQRGADIIVATPGRLMDHIENKRVDLSHIEMLVLDEADRMLDMGFIDDVQYIAKLTPSKRQTLLFSATVDKKLSHIVKSLLQDPVRIDLSETVIAAPLIQQIFYRVSNQQQKNKLLKYLLSEQQIYKGIIFAATKIYADNLAMELRSVGFAASPLHGDLRQNVRNRTVEDLRRGKISYIVATDVAARGIDIRDVTHVINYDLPRFCEDYVHRIGRTGRAGKEGTAISFVSGTDAKHLQRIERYIGQRVKIKSCPDLSDGASYQEGKAEAYVDENRHEERSGRPAKSARRSDDRFSRSANDNRGSKFGDGRARKPRDSKFSSEERTRKPRDSKFGSEERARKPRDSKFSDGRGRKARDEKSSFTSSETKTGRFAEGRSRSRDDKFAKTHKRSAGNDERGKSEFSHNDSFNRKPRKRSDNISARSTKPAQGRRSHAGKSDQPMPIVGLIKGKRGSKRRIEA